MTFKKGDKVRIKQRAYVYSYTARNAKRLNQVGEVSSNYDGVPGYFNVVFPTGTVAGIDPVNLELAEVKPTEPLAETLAEVEAKIQAAVKESGDLAQKIQNARGTLKALEDQKAEADKRILEFGKQTVKLKELEAKPKQSVKVGDTVKSLRNGYVGQYGVVAEVRGYPDGGLPSVIVDGAFYDRHGNESFQLYLYGNEYEVAK